MLDQLLRLAAPYLLPAAVAGLITALAWGMVQTWRLHSLEAELATEQAERAAETALRERIAREAEQSIAILQAAHARAQQDLTSRFRKDIDNAKAAADAAAADAASLSDAVACYASGDCVGPKADAATGGTRQHRAATIGRLFGRADTLAGRMASAAERHAAEVRALQAQLIADRAACGGSDAN